MVLVNSLSVFEAWVRMCIEGQGREGRKRKEEYRSVLIYSTDYDF